MTSIDNTTEFMHNDNPYNLNKNIYCRDSKDENIRDMPIYRYKFTQEFMDVLFQFSKVHQYDDRNSFKEAWTQWLEENKELVESEIVRLSDLNYDGSIIEKMYKSARYYYRKKGTEKKAPIDRRQYLCSQKDLLTAMDEHINGKKLKPSIGFNDFCQNNIDLLQTEVNHMIHIGFKDSQDIKEKIKKTYKNRYFLLVKQ
jgi:hypothetical protein